MNRHHPYGGGGFDGPNRRGGGPGGFGPDRSYRYENRGGPSRGRGGFRGGRGGGGGGGPSYGGYGGPPPYDQGPPQGDAGGYNNYDSGSSSQDYYHQNTGYGQQYPPPDGGSDYNQGYGGNYEDDSGNYGSGGFGRGARRGGGGAMRGGHREKDDKVHDSIIEERIQRERPCRTLFIRNIKYETNSEDVRRLFEEHGEIKTFFDLIANRGMVFVTYYDLRAAERARERLQGSEISGRPIDVHYSLPRDDHGQRGGEKERNQQLQGSLIVTLRNSVSGQMIDDNEVRRKFQQFGDVKSVHPVGDRHDQRYVEFYDTRACEEAHDRLRHQGLQDGVMEIVFASDLDDPRAASPTRRGGFERGNHRDWNDYSDRGHRGGRGGRGRGGRGRGRGGWGGGGAGGGGGGDDWDRRDDWGRDRDRSRSFDNDEFGRNVRPGSYDNRGPASGPHYGGPPPPPPGMMGPGPMSAPGGYGGAPPPPPPAAYPPPPAPAPAAAAQPPDDRLEQAKRVQQLLAALKQPGAPSGPSSQGPPPPVPPPPMPPAHQPPYYGAPPPMPNAYPGAVPPPHNPYSAQSMPPPPPPSNQPPAPAAPASGAVPGLPPNIMALLQQGQGQSQSPPPPAPPSATYSMPPPQNAGPPPPVPGVGGAPPPPPNGQQGYQQLMAYLSQKRS